LLCVPSGVYVARAQRGATERSEFKKYFSIQCILIGFFSIISVNLFFVWDGGTSWYHTTKEGQVRHAQIRQEVEGRNVVEPESLVA